MSSEIYIPGETTVPYQCTPGPHEEVVATVLRKIFSGLSVFGSLFIVWTIYLKWRYSKSSIDPYCRIMLGLSLYDVIWSFFPWFMGSWLMPAGTGHWGANGNTQTCTMQGFFFWLGVPGAQYYQILLSLHTLLLVTFRWKTSDFEKKIERHSHKVIFAVALVLATVPIFFEGYNPECSTCLPAPLPIWCGDWIFWGDGETECIRGNPTLSTAYYTIYLTNLSIMGVFCTCSMIQVYFSVRGQEDRNARYSFRCSNSHREKSRRIRRTMILYTFGFYLCWVVPSFIIHFAQQGTPIMIMSYILLPFQGFFNLMIFLAPKCAKYQKTNPGTSLVMAYICIIFGKISIPCNRCYAWLLRNETFEAIRRRSSHRIQSPFRLSASNRNMRPDVTALTAQMTAIEDYEDDDGIGFQDFNEEPIIPATNNENEEPIPTPSEDDEGLDGEDTPGKQEVDDEGENGPKRLSFVRKRTSVVRFSEDTLPAKNKNDDNEKFVDDDVRETQKNLDR